MIKRDALSFMASGLFVLMLAAGVANAQVSKPDQKCINAFSKSAWKVAKTHGGIVAKCLRQFAAGTLIATTPEACVTSDPGGKLTSAVGRALHTMNSKCAGGLPPFGVTPVDIALSRSAFSRAALGEIDLVHGSIAANLDAGMFIDPVGASCQSKVAAALLKCQDTRLREFVKCEKHGLGSGQITDAATLTATCLGTGNASQPDNGKIALACGTKLAQTIARSCTTTPIVQAFAACGASSEAQVPACLSSEAACQTCRILNDVDGLARDCDLFDDGDTTNGTCGEECADGVLQTGEACDDGNLVGGDGCSNFCKIEGGWTCSGEPSVCTPNCGNGVLDAGETCDDGANVNGDGCSSACVVEDGYACTGEPSVCTPKCGNGVLQPTEGETCDDHNHVDGDGCSSRCQIEEGYACTGQPSTCTFVCGNNVFNPGETCDDGNVVAGDGCSALCKIETGWHCSGQPSTCTPACGDGLVRGAETCDDGNVTSGDGCSSTCLAEAGYTCAFEPSNCIPICGDGFVRGSENCDDGNTASDDGCSGEFCRQEVGWTCVGQPSVCTFNCGDGNLDADEECDDGDTTSGDGCSETCLTEQGYACGGQPSVCVPTCGNGVLQPAQGEECDDGNTTSRDGCDASCRNESGWLCTAPGVACQPFEIFIDSPVHGIFTTASSINVTGHYTTLLPGQTAITINGVPASSVDTVHRTFSHTLTLNAPAPFNPVLATLTNTTNGDDVHDRVVVIKGASVADGALSPQSVAMRMNDSGLDTVEPLVAMLAGDALDLAGLLPAGTVMADQCFLNVIGCWGSAKVKIANPAPSFGSFSLALDSKPNAVGANIAIKNLRLDIDIEGSGLVPNCGLRVTATQMSLNGDYALEPKAGNPRFVDVNLVGNIGAGFTGFSYHFTYGLCTAPIIGDIINAIVGPMIQNLATDGINGFIGDPDGAGPLDSPIAAGIEDTLAGISISGAVGSGLGMTMDAPLFEIAEDNTGITFGAGASFTTSTGTGPGQCVPPPGAPNFASSYAPPEAFPSFGANTPVSNAPYGIGLGISSAAFNQLLRGQTECGLMRTSLTEIDLDGPGGVDPVSITSSLLSLLVPEFGKLPPNTPLRIDIAPTLAPVVTGAAGPAGELTELRIAHMSVDIVEPGPETVWLSGAFDTRLGLNMAFLPDGSGLAVTVAAPEAADMVMTVIYNPLGTNETQLEETLPAVFRPLVPSLAGALSGFPVPQFFGLNLQGVEVSKNGGFLSLFANLAPTP
jgi:cysteine-rich repeat protein